MTRVFVCVLDGVGAGALPDAAAYGDAARTPCATSSSAATSRCPTSSALGLGEVVGLPLGAPRSEATYGRLLERGAGKDTTTGHWEMMGVVLEQAVPDVPGRLSARGHGAVRARHRPRRAGQPPASGTEIIEELGDEHVASGRPIVYTSADSVFQIACHEDVVPVAELYEWCEIARAILQGQHAVGRVIARPFDGASGHYARTPRRRDFSLEPPGPTYLDLLQERGVPVSASARSARSSCSAASTSTTTPPTTRPASPPARATCARWRTGCCSPTSSTSTRSGATATTWRASPAGSPRSTRRCPAWAALLQAGDVMILCADHGVDPTTASTDHSREYSPLLALGLAPGRYDGAAGGRRRDRLRAPHRGGAAAARTAIG